MMIETAFYRDLAYVFGAALIGGFIAHRFRQPLILGYILAGIMIGPFTPGPTISQTHVLEQLAEIGVILLMYSIGIEFSFRDLLRVKWVALIGAPLGILLSILLGLGVGGLLGWPVKQGIVIGVVVSVASTMVLSRLLVDRGELHSDHGQLMIGITLIEDLAVVLLTILLPVLNSLSAERLGVVLADISKALLFFIPLAFAAAKLVPAFIAGVTRIGNKELSLLATVALGFATAVATQALGLSLALGAFLAGLVITESKQAQQTLARLLPLRDVFVALFFVTVGALIDPRALISAPGLLAIIVCLIVGGKLLIWTLVVRLFGYPLQTALLVGFGLTQIGEFSYVLVQIARHSGLVNDAVFNATLAASLLTIVLNAGLFQFASRWLKGGLVRAPAA